MIRSRWSRRSPHRESTGVDFTGELRALLADEQTDHTPDTERIRARLLAAGVPAAPAGDTAGHRGTDRHGTERAAAERRGTAERRTAPRRRLASHRPRRARVPLLVGASTAALATLLLLNGMVSGDDSDLGTVTAASHPATGHGPEGAGPAGEPDGGTPGPGQAAGSPSPSQHPPGPTPGPSTTGGPPPADHGSDPAPSGAPDGAGPPDQDGPPSGSDPGADPGQERRSAPHDGSDDSSDDSRSWSRGEGGDGRGSAGRPQSGSGNDPGTDSDSQGSTAAGPALGDGRSGAGTSDASARPFGRDEQVHLPTAGCLDWVLFNAGGVQTRAATPRARIGTSRIRAGIGVGGFPNPFSWTDGQPARSGSQDNDRLMTSRVGLDVDRTSEPRRLDLYLGSADRTVTVVVGEGPGAAFHRVVLGDRRHEADAVLSVVLPRSDRPTPVTVLGSDPLTLAAAVLY